MRPLVLVDRDGTVIVEKGFLGDPAGVELIAGAAAAIRKLNEAGWAVAIATNQSGVGRGFYSLERMRATNDRLVALLEAEGARLDAVEFCPHHPEARLEEFRKRCSCRKPGTGMAANAAAKLNLSADGAAVVGDRLVDVEMGLALGGPGILVLTGVGEEQREDAARAGITPTAIVPDLRGAVDWLLKRKAE